MTMPLQLTENDIRTLRDNIYGKCSNKNWKLCRKNWTKSENIKWLIKNQPKEKNEMSKV